MNSGVLFPSFSISIWIQIKKWKEKINTPVFYDLSSGSLSFLSSSLVLGSEARPIDEERDRDWAVFLPSLFLRKIKERLRMARRIHYPPIRLSASWLHYYFFGGQSGSGGCVYLVGPAVAFREVDASVCSEIAGKIEKEMEKEINLWADFFLVFCF